MFKRKDWKLNILEFPLILERKAHLWSELNEYEQTQLKELIPQLKQNIEKEIQFGSAKIVKQKALLLSFFVVTNK